MTLYSKDKDHRKYYQLQYYHSVQIISILSKLHTSALEIMSHAICLPSLISNSSRIIDILAGQFCAFLF